MRQVGDSLIWLAMIAVFVAVIYFTPRVAHYVHAMDEGHERDCVTCRGLFHQQGAPVDRTP
jgi:hypothetical protein